MTLTCECEPALLSVSDVFSFAVRCEIIHSDRGDAWHLLRGLALGAKTALIIVNINFELSYLKLSHNISQQRTEVAGSGPPTPVGFFKGK